MLLHWERILMHMYIWSVAADVLFFLRSHGEVIDEVGEKG